MIQRENSRHFTILFSQFSSLVAVVFGAILIVGLHLPGFQRVWSIHICGISEESLPLVACVGSIQDTVTEKITMYHPTYLFQTPSGVTQETVNRKGQARICDAAEKHWSCDSSCVK